MTLSNDYLSGGFQRLFAGNLSALGGNEGLKIPSEDAGEWELGIESHLNGDGPPVGVYPMSWIDYEWHVHWGCVDWDEGYEQSWPDAINTHNALKAFGITSWIERSRSKGWHLWVFANRWVPAEVMRNALIAACQIVDAPIKEVNPKQTSLSVGGVGNYVRLPYPNWKATRDALGAPQTVVDAAHPGVSIDFPEFVVRALERRCTVEQLETLAERAVVKTRSVDAMDMEVPDTELDPKILRKLDGLSFTILTHGPGASTEGDRSATLWKLARQMWDSGKVTKEEAWAVMCDADLRWGKHLDRDDVATLWATFSKAWDTR